MNYIAHLFYNYFQFSLIINLLDIKIKVITNFNTLPSWLLSNPIMYLKKQPEGCLIFYRYKIINN